MLTIRINYGYSTDEFASSGELFKVRANSLHTINLKALNNSSDDVKSADGDLVLHPNPY